jgi:hypothetical protein
MITSAAARVIPSSAWRCFASSSSGRCSLTPLALPLLAFALVQRTQQPEVHARDDLGHDLGLEHVGR